ncbi:MAG: cyclase family protein [Bryobacterales bacterium]|nr:cyclase family protein [Bryobacterales bacterium]
MIRLLLTVALFVLSACQQQPKIGLNPPEPAGDPFAGFRWIDLTHAYDAETIFWPTGEAFEHVQTAWGQTPGGYFYSSYDIALSEHSGTHLDAPIHFGEGKKTADQIPLEQLAGPAVVVDVSAKAAADADYLVSAADIEANEAEHGEITAGSVVLLRTDWSKRWPNVKAYMGDDRPGHADALHFPGLAPEATELLAARGIHAVGIDTASIDYGPSADFQTHRILAAAEIPILENLTGLEQTPARGAYVIAMPMKIGDGSGGPCRVAALVR